jgi:hypothetical protein
MRIQDGPVHQLTSLLGLRDFSLGVLPHVVGDRGDKCLICVSHVACIVARAATILKHLASECVSSLMSLQLIYIVRLIVGDCVTSVKEYSFRQYVGCGCCLAGHTTEVLEVTFLIDAQTS